MELLIVGLDGLSRNMLERFDASAPFVEQTTSAGAAGPLRSVDPPTTLPAWTSFATGKDPGSHGVHTMLRQEPDYEIRPSEPNVDDAAIYDLLDDATFVNLPGSVERVPAGTDVDVVASILAADAAAAIPDDLADLDAVSEYVVEGDTTLQSRPEAYLEHLEDVTDARYRFAAEAFDRRDPRVGFVLFSTPDWIGHFLQDAPDRETAGEWYRRIVERADELAGRLAERADNVLVLSDHGFEPKERAVHPQTLLRERGFLDVTGSDRSLGQRVATRTARVLGRYCQPAFELGRAVYRRVDAGAASEEGGDLVDMNPDVEFGEATAWHLRYGCCYVNDDRFDRPTVDDVEDERDRLRDALADLAHDGEPVFSEVYPAEDVYEDPAPSAPDVVARPASGNLPLRALSPTGNAIRPAPSDTFHDHRYDGLVAARGPLFADDAAIEGASIVDVLPTVLHALGRPIPPDLDGEVAGDLLATDAQPTAMDEAAVPRPRVRDERADAEDAVAGRLDALGYLE